MIGPEAEAARLVGRLEAIHAGGRYGRIRVERPWSRRLPVDEGEIAEPGALGCYLHRELGRLLAKGARIDVTPGRPQVALTDRALRAGLNETRTARRKRLFAFAPERIALSAARIYHYTGTPAAAFQSCVLLTNYAFHAKTFAEMFPGCLGPDRDDCQMPAWHYQLPGGTGVSLVWMGVGPSNAKTISDQLAAAVRPLLTLLIGHCGGIRSSQQPGDLVVPSSYIRHDGVLDKVLHPDVPVTPEHELLAVIRDVIRDEGVPDDRWRMGRVYTTSDRDWDWGDVDEDGSELGELLWQGQVVAVEMEAAALAGNFQRHRQLSAALLIVSDRPLHHQPKLAGPALELYQASCRQHIGLAIAVTERFRKLYPEGIEL
jgi:AMP nucleosidase